MRTKKSPISGACLTPPGQVTPGELPELTAGKGFRSQEHIKRRVEITRVFKKGRAVGCSGSKLFLWANGLPHNRIVITFARKYGSAVQRNRARRLGREAYRLIKHELKTGYDLVLLLYPPAQEGPGKYRGSLAESTGRLKTLFSRAGIRRQGE